MKTKFNTRVLTGTAMLAAVATVLMYMEFPIPIMPAFIKLDVSELPALIASFAYGPVAWYCGVPDQKPDQTAQHQHRCGGGAV